MRTVFVGTVEGSLIAFNALVGEGIVPHTVVTLAPDKSSRHSDFVDLANPAEAAGSKVHFTSDINSEETLNALRQIEPDLVLVIGWSQICRGAFRSIPKIGSIGFHPAALPRLRGRAVIPWTILLDETEAGSSLFWLDEGTDSGPLVMQRRFPVESTENARSLYDKHAANLASMLPQAVRLASDGDVPRLEQNHNLATYCAKRTPEDGRIDWSEPAVSILRLIRAAGDPYPGAFTEHSGEKLIVDEADFVDDSWRYHGTVGQIQLVAETGFIVRCGDGECIKIAKWRGLSGTPPKVHSKLGERASAR